RDGAHPAEQEGGHQRREQGRAMKSAHWQRPPTGKKSPCCLRRRIARLRAGGSSGGRGPPGLRKGNPVPKRKGPRPCDRGPVSTVPYLRLTWMLAAPAPRPPGPCPEPPGDTTFTHSASLAL